MSRTTTNDRSGRPTWRSRLVGGLLALVLFPALASAQSVGDKYQQRRNNDSQFNLHATPTSVLRVNQYQCGLSNNGDTCTDVFDSPTGGGGFWPTGSPNQYMFNSGLQTTGVITMGADCNATTKLTSNRPDCFPWSGDTVGAFFMDAAGTRKHASPLSDIYDSLNPDDLANWPTAGFHPDFPNASAMVEDTSLFNPVLIGRQAASQQDTWVMYWDGDPVRTGGRTHPMGILVEQRTMAWNYPAGNEATIYFIYKFTNVTDNALFQRLNETRYALELPDEGWTIDSMYVAYMSDPDVTADYDLNYATASFPFNLGVAYDGTFFEPDFVYPPALFYPPFFTNAPGLLGVKYLKSPVDPATGEEVGLTSFSLTTNGGLFPDPSSVQRGWRYHSLNVDPGKGDPSCTFPLDQVKELRSCYLAQVPDDVRFYIGSGPFSLAPGQSSTVALAQYAAATVATPTIERASTADNKPGFPTLAPGCFGEPIRPLDIAMGYIAPEPDGCPVDGGVIDQFDVQVVPNSLLGKALVAQSIFDNNFLLGFAPDAPPFYLVPGNNQVTVIWEPSLSEETGDPFFAAAGDPTNALYDPNYREFDVEGYRIYRGTTPANMQLIAQFDKDGTVFTDNLCVFDPEHVTADPCDEVHEYDITAPFVQYTSIARLENGLPIVLEADTALATEVAAGTSQQLSDTGIPFAYVDDQVRNGFQYFYRVTAFDINSVRSGPTSLESSSPAKPTVPVLGSPNLTLASFNTYLAGEDGEPLESLGMPSINAEDGTFSGPMPPTNAIEGTFAPLVERLLPQMNLTVEIDSIIPIYGTANCTGSPAPGYPNQFNHCWKMHLTIDRDGQQTQVVQNGWSPVWAPFGGLNTTTYTLAQERIEADATAAAQYGIPTGGAGFNAAVIASFTESLIMSAHLGQAINRAGGTQSSSRVSPIPAATSLIPGGSRWFVGTSEEPDPARHDRNGHIPGIDSIWGPQSPGPYATGTNNACWGYNITQMARAADVEFRWDGSGAEVWDVTHNVPVDFKPSTQASYGFLTTDANGNGVLDYDDFHYIEGIFNGATACSRVAGRPAVQLQQTPSLVPVSTGRTAISTLTPTGQGFGIYVNGERYIVQTSSLPASGTWTHRSYQGWVTASSGGNTDNPSGYAFIARNMPRPAMVPNLKVVFEVESSSELTTEEDLTAIHTVPDPYYATSFFDLSPTNKELQFVNLPARATIRIYSLSGVLVHVINHEDLAGGGRSSWNLRNRSNQFVASGVYLFHVSTPEGKSHVGKFTVVNSGFGR